MIPHESASSEWPVSVKTGVEKSRWVILAFQSERTSQTETPAVFDNLGLTIAYITLNGYIYSNEDVVSDFAGNDDAWLYMMFDDFKNSFTDTMNS